MRPWTRAQTPPGQRGGSGMVGPSFPLMRPSRGTNSWVRPYIVSAYGFVWNAHAPHGGSHGRRETAPPPRAS
eukprot:3866268-Prymnesium_polylepis.1